VKQRICALIFLMGLTGCKPSPSNPLREPGNFAKVYAQVLVARRVAAPSRVTVEVDSVGRRARVDSVLAAQHLTRAQLADAVQYFSADSQRWKEVYQNVVNELDSLIVNHAYPRNPMLRKN